VCETSSKHQKPWKVRGFLGCGSKRRSLTIVGGHGRILGCEQVMQHAVGSAGLGLQKHMSAAFVHIRSIADKGRLGWQRDTSYGKRSMAVSLLSDDGCLCQ
jgi:hypothetical protein